MEWSRDTYLYKHQDFKCYIESLEIIIYVNAKSKDLKTVTSYTIFYLKTEKSSRHCFKSY